MRNLDKAKFLKRISDEEKITIDIRQLDVTQDSLIQPFIQNILNDFKKIDILINNAGSGLLGTLEQTSLSQAKEIMNVNSGNHFKNCLRAIALFSISNLGNK